MGEGQGCQDIVKFLGMRSGFGEEVALGQGNSWHVRVEGRQTPIPQGLGSCVEEVSGEPLNSSDHDGDVTSLYFSLATVGVFENDLQEDDGRDSPPCS